MKQISNRLQAIARLVGSAKVVCDVGTDHAYLPIYLCQHHMIERAIAMDINCGPLAAAQTNIAETDLSEQIETRLSNGLEKLQPQEADVIVISGMGGDLIREILDAHPKVWKSTKLVLQPQSHEARVREYLFSYGMIEDEDMLIEDGKYYTMFRFAPSKQKAKEQKETWTTDQRILYQNFGPILYTKRHPILAQYCNKRFQRIESILPQVTDHSRLEELKNEYNLLKTCKEWMNECI